MLDYISGAIPLLQFRKWFASKTWDVGADDTLRRLINEIDLLLAEFSSGDWTENEFKDNLQQIRQIVQFADVTGTVFWTQVRSPYSWKTTNGAGGFEANSAVADVPVNFGSQIEAPAATA